MIGVDSAESLTKMINCYNSIDAANTYTVSFTSDITLAEALPAIDNATAGVALDIMGNGRALDVKPHPTGGAPPRRWTRGGRLRDVTDPLRSRFR